MKKYLVLVIALILVAIIAVLVKTGNKSSDLGLSESPTPSTSTSPKSPRITGAKIVEGIFSVTNITPKLSYSDTLSNYRGKLMQFDETCHPSPYPNLVFKNGVSIMFDNRSTSTRTIKLDEYKFTLKPYGWSVLTLKSAASTLPHKVMIDCDSGQNYGSILLEK